MDFTQIINPYSTYIFINSTTLDLGKEVCMGFLKLRIACVMNFVFCLFLLTLICCKPHKKAYDKI